MGDLTEESSDEEGSSDLCLSVYSVSKTSISAQMCFSRPIWTQTP